ncbi:MAG: hypothetical protein AAGE85_13385 [Pseudomonadota bacterium]
MAKKPLLRALRNPAWLCFTWFGITAGVSLLATPARFSAGSVTRPIALDVGREVFAVLNKAELVLLVALLILVRTSGDARRFLLTAAALTLIVVAQSAWLLPELSARTDMVLAGQTPPPSMAHAAYSILELLKLALLLWTGFSALAGARGSESGLR